MSVGAKDRLSPYELSQLFTIFVMLQFWNMFNARRFETGCSSLHLKGNKGFSLILLFIIYGQILIVEFGGRMFNVTPIKPFDWAIIIVGTSVVLWIGELKCLFTKSKKNEKCVSVHVRT